MLLYIRSESTQRSIIDPNKSPTIADTVAACHVLALMDWAAFDVEIETLRVHTVRLDTDEIIHVGNKKFLGKNSQVYHILFKIRDLKEKISRLFSYTAVYYNSEIDP